MKKENVLNQEVLELEELETEDGDVYTKVDNTFGGADKKQNVAYWENIDAVVEDAVTKIANMVGVDVKEWSDYSIIKEAVGVITSGIEEKFEVDFKFVNENF